MIAVGYGKAGTPFEVDDGLLNTLATHSVGGGYFLDAFADDSGLALRKQFRQAIVDGLHLDPTHDPTGILTPANPEARYEVTVLPYDTKVAFVVDWVSRDAPISVSIVTPLCEVITEQSAPRLGGVFFRSGPFHRVFVFDNAFLSNTATPTQPRYGAWKLIVNYSPVVIEARAAAIQGEQFQYEVITESRLKMDVQFDKPKYGTGDRIGISASLTLDGQAIPNASVILNVAAPGRSFDNFIASTQVTPALLERAKSVLSKEDVTAVGIKSYAIQLKGGVFNEFSNTRNIVMVDSDNSGVYEASIDATSVPGSYDFYVTAVGVARGGVAFRRERRVSQRVEVIPRPEFTLIDVIYLKESATIRVLPRDQFGNVILFDPAFNPRIGLTASAGEFRGGLTFNGDGSYTGTLVYPGGAKPTVQVTVDGTVVVPGFPLQPVTAMIWVDDVVDFHAGAEARPGVNAHKNPAAVLGDPLTKAPDQFVSLGGRGSITIAIKGHLIANSGGDDLTVFVQPDSDLRAYAVQAGVFGNQWVTLGASKGVDAILQSRQTAGRPSDSHCRPQRGNPRQRS
ncbi:MAG: hypothetical protein WDO73_04525 [Ignavibacteriota bacterium]